MRCFACNVTVDEGYDKLTDRFYCAECMEPTNEILLENLEKELNDAFGFGLDALETNTEDISFEGFTTLPEDSPDD